MTLTFATPKPMLANLVSLDTLYLDQLVLSDLNPRTNPDAAWIANLADSILEDGLLQNLAGLKQADGYVGIVAGGRRLRALRSLAEQGKWDAPVPVLVTSDEAVARSWAATENIVRDALNPADEVLLYAREVEAGRAVPKIAAAFGVTEAHVQRRLRLSRLPRPALDALRRREINLDHAAALTLCRDDSQFAGAMELALRTDADRLRRSISESRISDSDRRVVFVGLDAYRAAGGAITRDLFSERVFLEDAALLDRLWTEALQARVQTYLDQGWAWAEAIDDHYLPHDLSRQYGRLAAADPEGQLPDLWRERLAALKTAEERGEELSSAEIAEQNDLKRALQPEFTLMQRAVSGVIFCVDYEGKITDRCEKLGLVHKLDMQAAIDAGVLTPALGAAPTTNTAEDAPDTTLSAALRADLRAIELHALQERLRQQPILRAQLLAVTLSDTVTGRPLDVTIRPQPNTPSQPDGFRPFAALRSPIDLPNLDAARQYSHEELREYMDLSLMRGMIYGFHYNAPTEDYLAVLQASGASKRDCWTPTRDNFFARANGPYLDRLYCDLFDLSPADDQAVQFIRMKKAEKANLLHMLFNAPDAQRRAYPKMTPTILARIDAWEPDAA